MTDGLKAKLAGLPVSPGVYLYKNNRGRIIYVGKAAVLRNRVRQYFHPSTLLGAGDAKTQQLLKEVVDIDWLVVGSEIEALFLESELIKRYKPKYNIELRDDKHYEYVRIDIKSTHPTVQIVRRPLDDRAEYIGPFVQGIRTALKLLRRVFPYDTSIGASRMRSRLMGDIGLSPGLEEGRTSLSEYKSNLRKLTRYLNGKHKELERRLQREMKAAARARAYERAARLRNQLEALKRLRSQVIFSDKELFDITKDQALDGLTKLLGLPRIPRRIEGYDISHLQGTHTTASMVVFTDGVSDKQQYRKFRSRVAGNDDFAHMREVITRRFSGRNLDWPKPDLLLIDGGKGQVSAALGALREIGLGIPVIGLAKRFEEIIIPRDELDVVSLPPDSPVIQLLQRIRDESHRFAVSYHSTLRGKGQTSSQLESIPGVGPATRKKLLRQFGSLRGVVSATEKDLVKAVGTAKARAIKQQL